MNRAKPVIIIGVIILLGLIAACSGLYEDWLWFKDLGYSQLFWTPFISKFIIQFVNGSILFIFIAGTLLSIRHAIITFINDRFRKHIRLVQEMDQPIASLSRRRVTVWILVISAVISIATSFVTGFTGWLEVLTFFKSTAFNKVDPVFGRDLSFYFFQLPFLQTLFNAFFAPLFLLTLFTALFYTVTGVLKIRSLRFWSSNAVEIDSAARRHLAFLICILFAFKVFGYYIDIYQILYSQHGHVVGAGFADIIAGLPGLKILLAIGLIGFLLAIASLIFKESRLITLPVVTIFLASVIFSGVIPTFIQSFIVAPNELDKEYPYIQNEISSTRFGFGLDNIQEQDYPGTVALNSTLLNQDKETLNNIRLNDTRPMLQTYMQKQGIRLYYKFNDIDVDRYRIDNQYRQVMLSPRELSTADLESKAKTFVNLRFKYTHGYGVAASFANTVTSEGLPSFAIKDVPPQTDFADFEITQPRIYYGELTNDWVIVNTTMQEFDYPQGNENAENSYQGTTGIYLTPLNKLMLSIHNGTFRFYLANEINSGSRILLHRNIIERVNKLAPFLTYDQDPYMVIDSGRLKWILDAYTTSNELPYSNSYPDQNYNYIRNSVKVVIDAYNGNVDFYAADQSDPVLATYMKIFPGVFKPLEEMPVSLRTHLRYPETLFSIQSNMLKTFHMKDVDVFYNKEDAWDIAKELYQEKPQNVDPYYTILKLPGMDKAEFVLMLPFTPASSTTNTRNNMVAWLGARMDGENYGQLLLYKLPKNIEIDGPLQVESRIDQDPEISKQLSLWDQKGSSVIRGNLLVYPIAGSFLYVEPIYLQSDKGGSIPEMKRVILAYQEKLVMTETLDSALVQIFGENVPLPSAQGQSVTPAVPQQSAEDSQKTGTANIDVNSVIEQINRLKTILDNLEKQLQGSQTTDVQTPGSQ